MSKVTFETYVGAAGAQRWRLKDSTGNIVASGQAETAALLKRDMDVVKATNARTPTVVIEPVVFPLQDAQQKEVAADLKAIVEFIARSGDLGEIRTQVVKAREKLDGFIAANAVIAADTAK